VITNRRFLSLSLLASSTALTGTDLAWAETYLVEDQSAYENIIQRVVPGDEVVLADGDWRDFQIVFSAIGTEAKPITLRAETPGGVRIIGQSSLALGGEHLVVSGLTFTDGHSPSNTVVAFKTSDADIAQHVRFTNNVIENFNQPERTQQDSWVVLYGRNNRVDQNAFLGKTNKGMTLIVRLDDERNQQNNHLIEHNYFGPRDPLGGNGGETIRIGTSFTSRTTSGTVVRRNYFERCSGEVEIISMKSEGNVITENVFFESRGSVVFRHGGHNEVSRNVFFGNGVPDTGGVRVINDNQVVRDNYLEGLRGEKFLGALVVMNGVPNSPQNRYHQVENAQILNNTFVDVAHVGLGVGTDDERSAVPVKSAIQSNIFTSASPRPVGLFDDMSGIELSRNYSVNGKFGELGAESDHGLTLKRGANGLLAFDDGDASLDAGAPSDLMVISRDQTGPQYFTKPKQKVGSSQTIKVAAGTEALREAVAAALPGSTLVLPPYQYEVKEPIRIAKPLTIRGTKRFRPTTLIADNGLFQVAAGADLSLENVVVVQSSVEKPVIKAVGQSYGGAYTLALQGVIARVGGGASTVAPLLAADPETFAQSVRVDNLSVSGWMGDLINFDASGREGWYLSDFISITDSKFRNVSGALVTFGRDGRDESTFGPRFELVGSTMTNIGASGSALVLPGIDGLKLTGNTMNEVGRFEIKRRVLGFPFDIGGNDVASSPDVEVRGVAGDVLEADLINGMSQ